LSKGLFVGGESPGSSQNDMFEGFFPNALSTCDSEQGETGSPLSVVLGCGKVENAPVIDGAGWYVTWSVASRCNAFAEFNPGAPV
jgi:hypothetical protein